MEQQKAISRRALLAAGAGLALATAGCAPDAESESKDGSGSSGSAARTTTEETAADEAAADGSEETEELTALHVAGTQLVDEAGAAVQLRGVSTHGLAWYPEYVNEECFAELHDEWGATVVRLALYTSESGGWCTDGDQGELREVIDRGVAAAVAAKLYVIIDWHVLNECDPNVYVDEACDFFDDVSAAYADLPNVIYEICNEPNGSATWDDVKAYAAEVLPVIRANAPEAVVLVGTPTWSQDIDLAAADPIDDDNLLYTLHFYAATHTDSLRAKLREAVEGGLPAFVSEYGICDASGAGAIDEDQAAAWIELMDELGVSYVAWNLSNKDETSAMIASSCTKVSGFDENDLSESGAWVRAMLLEHAGGAAADGAEETEEAEEDADEDEDTADGASGLACTWYQDGSWESDGAHFAKFALTISNGTDAAISGWTLTVTFDQEIELSDSWNGSYSASGSTLTIQNASYNGQIAAGAETGDIGFIVSGATTPAIEGVTCIAS